jgi:ABC-2 type transport system ATP-binding protein
VPSREADVVAATRVVVRLGRRDVLTGLTLRARHGELTAVLGPNGAGKTTFIRCCAGLISPSSGELRVLGLAPGAGATAALLGFMPQSTGAWSGIKAGELLRYLASLYAHPHDVAALIARMGIGAFADLPYRRLSGGQQQTVNLAGALVGRPQAVFLDEPTAGLDPHARRTTWELLRELRASGVSIVLTTHSMDEAATLADRVHILDRGRIAVTGTVADLTADGTSLEDVFLRHTHAEPVR